ncbi:MAG: MotA/TolQ/ExbB proton channel family protein [Pirellulaceae bacterium]|nr:MotA/TolQ/ExbB proton channel family protein [Pirellulaceae bacterium]
MAQGQGGVPATTDGGILKKLVVFFGLALLSAAATAGLFVALLKLLPGGYLTVLLTERGYFQHVNVFLFFLGCGLLFRTLLASRQELAAIGTAERLIAPLASKWQSERADDASTYTSIGERHQRDQGEDLLAQMREANLVVQGNSGPRLARGANRLLLQRLLRIGRYLKSTGAQNLQELSDMNRDLSALDAESLSGQFLMVRYFNYLMPVIGFLGTVWGIGAALGGISNALPNVTDLKGFTDQLGNATVALQTAFDTTLLALATGGLLTFGLTLIKSQSDDVLSRVDTWMIDNVLSHITERNATERLLQNGFAALLGTMHGMPYTEGLGGIRQYLDQQQANSELQSQLEAIRYSLDSLAAAPEALQAELRSALDRATGEIGQVVEQLRGLAENCDQIRRNQALGQDQVRALAEAVAHLPSFAAQLDRAAGQLSTAIGGIAGFAGQFEAVGRLAGDIGAGARALNSIQANTAQVWAALARGPELGNGEVTRINTITAIIEMRDALNRQIGQLSRDNAQMVHNLNTQVAQSNDLISGGLNSLASAVHGVDEQMRGLAQAFLKLSNAITNALLARGASQPEGSGNP